MAKSIEQMKPSSHSCSKVAVTRALSFVRSKQKNKKVANCSQPRNRSATKLKKAWQNKIYSRCSPSFVVDLMEQLDEQKLKLVNQMGFQGLASLKLNKLNRQFGAWLLSKLDPVSGVLCAGTRSELMMTCEDVNRVLGIPCKGQLILPPLQKDVSDLKAYLCYIFDKSSWNELTIPFLERLMTRRSDGPLDADEVIRFKIAFIIYVITKFLAPQSYNNFISTRYLKAIVDIENVHNYNWADFIFEELKNASATLQSKIKHRKSVGYINGCIILIQIFYIDNLDFGKDNISHNILPRIGLYDDNKLADFIERDIVKNRTPIPSYGKLKLRGPNDVCYGRGREVPTNEVVCLQYVDIEIPSFDLGISQTPSTNSIAAYSPKKQMTSNLVQDCYKLRGPSGVCYGRGREAPTNEVLCLQHVDIEVPSFDLGISQTPSTNSMEAYSPIKQMTSNLVQDCYKVDYSKAKSTGSAYHSLENNHLEPPVPHVQQYLEYVVPNTPESQQGIQVSGFHKSPNSFISPHSAMREVSGIRIILREEYACTKYPPKAKRRIIGEPSDILLDRPKRTIKPTKIVKSPFLCKQQSFMRYDLKAVEDLYVYTISKNDEDSLNKIWVHISNPIPLTLNLQQIQQALSFDVEMPDETFNVAIQALFEDELHRFRGTEFVGWRHFLNQDFSMFAAAGEGLWNPEDHLHSFKDDTLIPYDVCNCRLIFIPVHHTHHFSLYAYDMHNKKLCILDSLRDTTKGGKDLEERHTKTKFVISKALHQCLKLCFPEWDEDIPNWPFEFPTKIDTQENKLDCSFHVMNYMRNWDGSRLVNTVCNDPRELRKAFLANLLSFRKNEAILPDYIIHCLKASNRK